MINIAITGSTGVLGKILCRHFADSNDVTVSAFTGDITKQEEVDKWISTLQADHLFHLAALVPVIAVNEDPFMAYNVNVGGTINLLSAVKKYDLKAWFFYASTSHVYKSSDSPISETDPIEPINTYGLTKLTAEKVCESFSKSYNYPVCIGRIFSFYHDTQVVPFLYPSMMNRLQTEDLSVPFKLRGANCVRDIINAEQVVDIILRLKENKYNGIINIAGGEGITVADFVRRISPSPVEIEAMDNDYNCLVADISKLKQIGNE